jgi:hypothetical protein
MKPGPKLLMVLMYMALLGVRAHSQEFARGQLQTDTRALAFSSMPMALAEPHLGHHRRITRYSTRFDGDHSLDAAIVTEQAFARYTLYEVQLQFASGAEQSIVVSAPPGGLQPEMQDMSGDSIPNDLVLTSGLLRLPLIVLLNEGHDHLTVAISPGSFTSDERRALGPSEVHRASALPTPRFRTGSFPSSGGMRFSQFQANFFPSPVRFTANHADCASSSGRAPPAVVTRIQRAS